MTQLVLENGKYACSILCYIIIVISINGNVHVQQ